MLKVAEASLVRRGFLRRDLSRTLEGDQYLKLEVGPQAGTDVSQVGRREERK